MNLSIIIKALNEQNNIARAIESALKSIKGLKGEVILADSHSTDKTIEIAKKYPIHIVQLKNKEDRSCGMGAQLGYLHSKGEYIYILDGDMELNPKFIKAGIKELESDETLAGVGGKITEMSNKSMIFKRRKKGEASEVKEARYTDKLMMGGLYRRSAIQKAGYFSNPYLHAYEESDLGYRLGSKGYRMKRIPIDMVKHYGDNISSYRIFLARWKSRYLWGCGEFLRYNLFKPTFFKVAYELKIYIGVILWWILLISSSILFSYLPAYFTILGILTFIFLVFFIVKKRNIKEVGFSLFSWNLTAFGLICGFFTPKKDIKKEINVNIIK